MTAAFSPKSTVLQLAGALAAGRTTSRELVEQALARVADPHGEGARTFVKVYGDNARAAADAQDGLRKAGYVASPLAGLPVSIKDLFDIAGEQTLAGSKALDDATTRQGRRAGDRAAARCRRGADRPDEHDRVRVLRCRDQSALRHARQPV
jgi:Asp-tRNA(Asn)/Glu-tRNA(Gln) amidotransferase A subunit family amidase